MAFLDYVQRGNFRFATEMASENARVTDFATINKRLLFEVRALADEIETKKKFLTGIAAYFKAQVKVLEATKFEGQQPSEEHKAKVKEYVRQVYELFNILTFLSKQVDQNSVMAAHLAHALNTTTNLKKENVTDLLMKKDAMDRTFRMLELLVLSQLKQILWTCDNVIKQLEKMQKDEAALVHRMVNATKLV